MNNFDIRLVLELAKRDFTDRYAGSMLGALWVFFLPFFNIVIYMLVFSKIMGARLAGNSDIPFGYSLYLISGLIPWIIFNSTIIRSSNVFLEKGYLITRSSVHPLYYIFCVTLSETFTFFIYMGIFCLFQIFLGCEVSLSWMFIPVVFLFQQIFMVGLGISMAIVTIFVKDFRQILSVLLTFWFWFTPIVYVRDILPEQMNNIVNYNPVYIFVKQYQNIFLFGKVEFFPGLCFVFVLSIMLFLASKFLFDRLERDIRDLV